MQLFAASGMNSPSCHREPHPEAKGVSGSSPSQLASQPLGADLGLEAIHDHVLMPTGPFKAVDRPDTRTIGRRQHRGFALRSGQTVVIACERVWQRLDHDRSIEACIASEDTMAPAATSEVAFGRVLLGRDRLNRLRVGRLRR